MQAKEECEQLIAKDAQLDPHSWKLTEFTEVQFPCTPPFPSSLPPLSKNSLLQFRGKIINTKEAPGVLLELHLTARSQLSAVPLEEMAASKGRL